MRLRVLAFAAMLIPVLVLSRTASAQATQRRAWHDADSARFIASDIPLFWKVFDTAPVTELDARFQSDYFDIGSPGLRDFAARTGKAFDLAGDVYRQRARYDSVRAGTLRVREAEPALRAVFRNLKSLYDAAVFPDVYFVVGRFSLGGAALAHGLVIGAELYPDPAQLPAIVAHELIHYQQPPPTPEQTLLERAFAEGSADFIGEMISGATINARAQSYGRTHEHELWVEFKSRMHETTYYPWLYGKPPGDRPNDLGYFIGYRIAQAYYERAKDKRAAIAEILRMKAVDEILRQSGYEP